MSDSPYFQFYPSDWLAGTRGLTASETGVYITLVAMMYEAEGPIPADLKRLSRLCGSTPVAFKKAVDGLLSTGKLTQDYRGFSNARVEKEIEKRSEKRASASESANARWRKTKQEQRPPDANASNSQCVRNANQKPEPEEEDKSSSNARASRFEDFWQAYPHRNGAKKSRASAEAKYAKAVKSGVEEAALIDAARRYSFDRQVADGFAKDPTTWLNQKCWEDEVEVAKPQAVKHAEIGEIRVIGGKRKKYAGNGAGWLVIHD